MTTSSGWPEFMGEPGEITADVKTRGVQFMAGITIPLRAQ